MELVNGIPISWEKELDRSVPMVTQYWAIVRNMYCDSRSRVTALSEEELEEKIEQGQRERIYSDIVEEGTCLIKDPEALAVANREALRIRKTSCMIPPPEDLALISAAKKTDPSDWFAIEGIDPDAGRWGETRNRLRMIRADKENAYRAIMRARQQHTP